MKEFDEILSVIENDKLSGSISLVDRMVVELTILANTLTPAQQAEIILALRQFIARKPFFYAFQHLLGILKVSNDWKVSLENYKIEFDSSITNMANAFIRFTEGKPKTYLIHSNSKTTVNVFNELAKRGIEAAIHQTFSNPGGEGIIQGKQLDDLGFSVTMVDDSPSDLTLEKIDMFVSGADAILNNAIINKIGTRALAEKVRSIDKPYIVLADPRKFVSESPVTLTPEFEFIPRTLVSEIIIH